MSRLGTGVTKEKWLEGGQEILASQGFKAVKLRPLAESLKVTTGSFYHHFANFEVYLDELAGYFAGSQLENYFAEASHRAGKNVINRFRILLEIVGQEKGRDLMMAMRSWGHHNEVAATAVKDEDRKTIAYFQQTFEEYGLRKKDAHLMSVIALSLFVADIDPELANISYDNSFKRFVKLLEPIRKTPR